MGQWLRRRKKKYRLVADVRSRRVRRAGVYASAIGAIAVAGAIVFAVGYIVLDFLGGQPSSP